MNFFIPSSPITLLIAALLVSFLIVRIVSDSRAVRQSRRLYKKLLEIGKLQSQQSMTVLIELSRKAETIVPLLDSLIAQNYPLLQVIVIVKRPAGAAAKAKLAAYKRHHAELQLKVLSFAKGRTRAALLKRYATGDVLITLRPDEKLSEHFFEDLSLDFLNQEINAVVPDKVHQLDSALSTALYEHFSSLVKIKSALGFNHRTQTYSLLDEGVAFRRAVITKQTNSVSGHAVSTSRSAYSIAPSRALTPRLFMQKSRNTIDTLFKKSALLWASLLTVGALVTFFILFSVDTLLFMGVFAIVYTVLYSSVLFQNNAYRFIDKVSLLLLAPFALVYGVIMCIITLCLHGAKRVVKRRFVLQA